MISTPPCFHIVSSQPTHSQLTCGSPTQQPPKREKEEKETSIYALFRASCCNLLHFILQAGAGAVDRPRKGQASIIRPRRERNQVFSNLFFSTPPSLSSTSAHRLPTQTGTHRLTACKPVCETYAILLRMILTRGVLNCHIPISQASLRCNHRNMTFSPAGLFVLVGSGESCSSLFAQFQGQNWPIASCSSREFHQGKGKSKYSTPT
ncbi:hypothetical protein LY78DRAFT_226030 [Colletotrichum sublineola]|nr:hypothetical protein LY78DRAFT_226030 [Colletotrichum sublineola]